MLLYPDYRFHRIWEITPEWLAKKGINALLLDVDNTLTVHNSPKVPNEIIKWISDMREAKVLMFLLSNNSAERVKPFANKIGLDFIARAAKPMGTEVRRALKRLGIPKRELAVIGDQIFTDVLCGNLVGVHSILVEPIEMESFLFFKLKRRLEKQVLKHCHSRVED